ncbi:energy transducer TonB [Flavobacterium sp. P21]|uniref:energy transducer TonB n=1 Tax=Flavobacterium sp. P21 TaxID=3423948 RepID=UPI003D675D9E
MVSAESKAQIQTPTEAKDYLPMSEVDEKPTFPGGINEFYKFIQANYQTPKVQGLEGKLYMTFVIEKDGSVTGVKTLRDIGYGTGDEAVRVLAKFS